MEILICPVLAKVRGYMAGLAVHEAMENVLYHELYGGFLILDSQAMVFWQDQAGFTMSPNMKNRKPVTNGSHCAKSEIVSVTNVCASQRTIISMGIRAASLSMCEVPTRKLCTSMTC